MAYGKSGVERGQIHSKAPAAACSHPCGHHVFVVCAHAVGRRRLRDDHARKHRRRGHAGGHRRAQGRAWPGPPVHRAVSFLARGALAWRHGHELRERQGRIRHVCAASACHAFAYAELRCCDARHFRAAGGVFRHPSQQGGRLHRARHVLCGQLFAELFCCAASHICVCPGAGVAAGYLSHAYIERLGCGPHRARAAHGDAGHRDGVEIHASNSRCGARGAGQALCCRCTLARRGRAHRAL